MYITMEMCLHLVLSVLACVLVKQCAATHHPRQHNHSSQVGQRQKDIQLTDWVLAAHGSSRKLAKGTGDDWSLTFNLPNYHYPEFVKPFSTEDMAAGVNHRTSDNHIHIPILGNTYHVPDPEFPAGGEKHRWSPPVVWEIDGNTGQTLLVYNLSDYADSYTSTLIYTPDGYPTVAMHGGKTGYGSSPILILDKESDKVLDVVTDDNTEPMLLQLTNTEPRQLIWAAMYANAGVNIDGHTVDKSTFVRTTDTSAIIFSADGRSIYNNGFYNHDMGIYKFKLPLAENLTRELFMGGCETNPWQMASDTEDNLYAICGGGVVAYDAGGQQQWTYNTGRWYALMTYLFLVDTENVLIVGCDMYDQKPFLAGVDPATGKELWFSNGTDYGGNVTISAQPWAPRFPIPLANGNLAILISNNGVSSVVLLDSRTGKVVKGGVMFDFTPQMLTADSSNNVYAFGEEYGYLKAQRKALGGGKY
ncbi:uncharacterized protein LOC135817173 isoform X1 [Sycon ciliatum]|uniref:uncharacterized protein LOC135817173 isoform X1 n=2 Tax=Sycon ciliatum TaxID=27933 RepID=UPI0031F6D9AB